MLLYEHEGFIESEANEIQQLCRSTFAVSFGDPDQNKYELQATLCDYQDQDERRCRIAFYAKSLKRALVFTVAGTEKSSLWPYGQEALLELGYQLEDVNLKLSPAMLEVVLRDVPGVASPAEAHLQRSEYQRLLAELQTTCDEYPESAKGKRAALKLSTEKRLQERSVDLRELLEDLFSPQEKADVETATLLAQVKDLTARFKEAENAAGSERSQKEFNETITSAAEKRIQELEELLVYVETRSSDVLKQKRKVVELNRRIKGLDAELVAARDVLVEERDKQKQFVDDVKSANKQIAALQRALRESEDLREEAFAQLGEQESEAAELDKSYRDAELRIKVLDKELKIAGQRVDGFDEAARLAEELQVQLDKAEEQLNSTTKLNESLEEELSAAVEKCDSLQKSLQEAEVLEQANAVVHAELRKVEDQSAELAKENESLKVELSVAVGKHDSLQKSLQEAEDLEQANAVEHAELRKLEDQSAELAKENESLKEELSAAVEKHDNLQKSFQEAESLGSANAAEPAELRELADRCDELVKENESLREEFNQERSIRKRLERGASENDRRVSALEQSLSQAEATAEELKAGKGADTPEPSATLDQGMDELTLRLYHEKAVRETAENELQEAHKLIDSLEKMVRATEGSASEKSSRKALTEQGEARAQELEERLRSLEDQLKGETLVKKALAKELAAAGKKLADQEASLAEASTVKKGQGVVETAAPVESEKVSKSSKPLPHEVRPAPKKGAFFRPDWDLQGLPCSSTGQVFKAWETVFNVQMAIEGYPSQYCMAFMVVLKQEKQKQLYLLFRLKQNKHTLICVPAKRPKGEASLQKAIKEGLDFLRKSGFDMDEMSAEHIESTLGAYCLEPD